MHERDSQFIDISLEEPGMEWDSRELRYLDEGSDVELDPHVDIADTRVNGGIGLVIQQESGGNSTNKPIILTKQQLIRPYLQAPRYNRAPLPDELKQSIDLSEYQPIIDMLRAQLGTLQKPSDKSPLSDFVSRTVAEEAVSGAVKTWTKIKHFRTNIDGSPRRLLGASSNISQWIGVLESALAAGLPPEVIARSYHRLEKICDVFPELNRPLNQTASSMHWRR
ncbi:hypothetical protein IWW36_004245 [Coemansia brasiliensis]|uniref:Uncharacterized protein n=1 Tax=Coemansia brasiliensis TaxID=2650707 RepID=A0A9W8IA32_9FUNG|nr:hypothetical protein IWW36_004245 [Coemansia brasiliensis]